MAATPTDRHDSASDLQRLRAAAVDDHDSVVALARELIAVPSRGGLDPYDGIIDLVQTWLAGHGLPVRRLLDPSGAIVGLVCEVTGAHPGPRWVLDACLDTAPYGDERAWTYPPTDPVLTEGWLHGRGAADSKSGVALFCHLAARLAADRDHLHGTLVLLLDVDEHTGTFGGAKSYFAGPDAPTDIAGVMIGYPGDRHLVVGGRGVHRSVLRVRGVASHSGGSKTTPNAIHKAAQLIDALSSTDLTAIAGRPTPRFPLNPKATVTAVTGGQGFSITPDLCTLNVDIRTTPAFDGEAAVRLIKEQITRIDERWPDTPDTEIALDAAWLAYALPATSPLRAALTRAATLLHIDLEEKIAGPANIGNYLAGLGIEATAGYGADYRSLHGTDERIRVDSLPTVHAVYHHALRNLLRRRE